MARLVDCCPSSDDELPELNSLIHTASNRKSRAAKTISQSPEKSLVPKSTSKSSVRKVRRLGGGSQPISNPLFQRWNSEDPSSSIASIEVPSKAPRARVREVRSKIQASTVQLRSQSEDEDEDEEDAPRLRVRSTRARRQVITTDSEEDSDEASDSDKEPLHTRIRKLQSTKASAGIEQDRKISTTTDDATDSGRHESDARDNDSEDDDEAIERQLLQEATFHRDSEQASCSEESSEDKEQESDDDDIDDDDDDDEPSTYRTAAEESSDYSEGSQSDFELDSPDHPSRMAPAKLLFDRPAQPAFTRKTKSILQNAPPLMPRDLNLKSKEPMISQKETASRPLPGVSKVTLEDGKEIKQKDSKAKTKSTAADLAESLAKLRLQLQDFSDEEKPSTADAFTTPPGTPPQDAKTKGLTSPSKHRLIPKTPHRPSMDAFWDQDTVNDWNDEHSPRKLILPSVVKSPAKGKEAKKESKKSWQARKHAVAEDFFRELDAGITEGKIAELAESTGGVKLVWTKTLNTTAGRANWRRETIRSKKADGTQVAVRYNHHASIELAEKVIDDEHRLLNVLAHEFCHLANFMISGMTTNPHGREFKAWAAKCSRAFGDRGIEVTTKHTYEIDFKFVWECTACGTEFKRHSRSIDPQRHRCGSCKSMLKQTKPVPRKAKSNDVSAVGGAPSTEAAGTTTRQPSRYQVFVKEQMRIVREENPGSPQKDVMRLIANKWAKERDSLKAKEASEKSKEPVGDLATRMVDLTLEVEA